MGFYDKIKNFVLTLQRLPEHQKRIIFFVLIAILVLAMGYLEILLTKKNIARVSQSLQSFEIPQTNIPDFSSIIPQRGASNLKDSVNALDNTSQENTKINP